MRETVDAVRKIAADIARHAARPGGHAHQPELVAEIQRHDADAVEAGHHRRRVPQQFDRAADIVRDRVQPPPKLLDDAGVGVESDAARPDHAAPKTVAAQHGRHVEHVAANASAIGHGGQEADVARQSAEVADMVGDPLQFQGHAAEELAAGGNAGRAEGFDGAAVAAACPAVLSPASVSA